MGQALSGLPPYAAESQLFPAMAIRLKKGGGGGGGGGVESRLVEIVSLSPKADRGKAKNMTRSEN